MNSEIKQGIEVCRPEARLVFLAINPKAGASSQKRRVDTIRSALHQADYEVMEEKEIDPLIEKIHLAQAEGKLRGVIAGGGDGTASFLANRLAPDIPLALLPLGTENLLAKHLGMSTRPADVCQLIEDGLTLRFDAGQVEDKLFLLMLSCGFDADVVRRTHEARSGHITRLSYIKPIVQSVRSYKYPSIKIYYEGDKKGEMVEHLASEGPVMDAPTRDTPGEGEPIEARWAFVVNVPRYAVGLQLVPEADPSDGLLDVRTLPRGGVWHGVRYFLKMLAGKGLIAQESKTVRASRIRIESEASVPYQIDGDPGGHLPIDVAIIPGRIRFFISRAWAQEKGLSLPTTFKK